MESLGYAFEERSVLFTDDTDCLSRNLLMKRDSEDEEEDDQIFYIPCKDALDSIGIRNSILGNQLLENCADETIDLCVKSSLNSLMEFGTRFSSITDVGDGEKLVPTLTEAKANRFSVDDSLLSSPEALASVKRARVQSRVPTCLVHGCNKDLSSSKGYHKRHKVCEVHSKTAVVMVNGINQRFCQQCSRFHILSEFDEDKRSCRKRLAGHNERRRKPQLDTRLARTSLLFSRILPGSFLGLKYQKKHELVEEPSQTFQSVPHLLVSDCLNMSPELFIGSNSSCALYLLSARSSNPSGMSTSQIVPDDHLSSTNTLRQRIPRNLSFSSSGVVEEEGAENAKNEESHQSAEGANTVGLVELSLHLQRVEQQKRYAQIKL